MANPLKALEKKKAKEAKAQKDPRATLLVRLPKELKKALEDLAEARSTPDQKWFVNDLAVAAFEYVVEQGKRKR